MKFSINDKVLYRRLDKKATIVEVVGGDEKRYIVKCGWHYWSVPEASLLRL